MLFFASFVAVIQFFFVPLQLLLRKHRNAGERNSATVIV